VLPSDFEPICPGCGYLRVGIANDARCPECGADGFADAFIIQGTPTRPVISPIIVIPIVVLFGTFVLFRLWAAVSRGALTFDIVPLVIGLLGLVLLAYRSLRTARAAVKGGRRPVGVWQFNTSGVVVRVRERMRHIPAESIVRIDCSDSLIAPVSQLMIVTRPFVKESLAMTPILYVHGTREQRRATWRRAREVLGLWSPSGMVR
jgi:hypothetical protein